MFWRRRKDSDVEEIGLIRRTIQDVLVPEMQAIKERLAGHDEKFVSIEKRFEQVDRRFDQIDKRFDQIDKRFEQIDRRFEQVDRRFEQIEKRLDAVEKSVADLRSEMHQGFAALRSALERIEARLQFLDFDKRLYRLELLLEHGHAGPKSSAA